MVNYFKNAFSTVVKNCKEVRAVRLEAMPVSMGEIDMNMSYCTIIVDIVINLDDLPFSEEGKMQHLTSIFPKELRASITSVNMATEGDDVVVSFYMGTQLNMLRALLDRELERAYFDTVEEALEQAAQQSVSAKKKKKIHKAAACVEEAI